MSSQLHVPTAAYEDLLEEKAVLFCELQLLREEYYNLSMANERANQAIRKLQESCLRSRRLALQTSVVGAARRWETYARMGRAFYRLKVPIQMAVLRER